MNKNISICIVVNQVHMIYEQTGRHANRRAHTSPIACSRASGRYTIH